MPQITLSAEELKQLIHVAVRDALIEVLGDDFSPEPRFTTQIQERLTRYKLQIPETLSADEVIKELGLDV